MKNAVASRPTSVPTVIEPLEGRTLYSAAGAHPVPLAKVKLAATKTTVTATAGTLGQPVTFDVTVRAAAAAGAPAGTVNLVDHGVVFGTAPLAAATSTNAKFAVSEGTFTETPVVGGTAYFFGRHAITAKFVAAGAFANSAAGGGFTVAKPNYTKLPDGVEYDTIVAGSGAAAASGDTVSALYTGYLAKNGKVFDSSSKDGGTPFSFAIGGGQVITGFNEGATGMQIGESRLVLIPPAEGYGATATGGIPKNSELLFELTLESIS